MKSFRSEVLRNSHSLLRTDLPNSRIFPNFRVFAATRDSLTLLDPLRSLSFRLAMACARVSPVQVAALALHTAFGVAGLPYTQVQAEPSLTVKLPATYGVSTRISEKRRTLNRAARHHTEGPPVSEICSERVTKGDDTLERLESVKCAVVGAISGSLIAAPVALLSPNRLTAQWEFDHDALALSLALGALVYRYAVRTDGNMMLKQGVVSAFVVTRTLSLLKASDTCTALPLNCGAPLGYLDWAMLGQGIFIAVENCFAFAGMAFSLEKGFEKGILKKKR